MEKISKQITNSCKSCTARCCRGLAVVLTIPEALRLIAATGARAEEVLEFRRDIDSRATPHYPLLVRAKDGVNNRGLKPAACGLGGFRREPQAAIGCAPPTAEAAGSRAPAVVVEEWFIIIRRQGRDCIFLGEGLACSIYNSRPYVCRLYPLELDGKSVKKGALCPLRFAREANMGKDAEALKKDLLLHEVIARKWGIERGAKGEKPDIAKFLEYFQLSGVFHPA